MELIKASEYKIQENKAKEIKSLYYPMIEMLESMEGRYNDFMQTAKNEISNETVKEAKRLRLDISRVRIDADKARKTAKEEYLRAGNAIQGAYNTLLYAVKSKEENLIEIEKHFENIEKERLQKLQEERVLMLSKYIDNASEINFSEMQQDVFQAYYDTKKKEYEDRIEAEKKAEEERIAREKAEAEERERIRKENEKLKKEAEERKKKEKIEAEKRAKLEAERVKKEEAERLAREKREREEREAYEAKIKKEREEKERIENELIKKQNEEKERLAKIEEEKEHRLKMGDSLKFQEMINDLEGIKNNYSFKSKTNTKKHEEVKILIDKIIKHIK